MDLFKRFDGFTGSIPQKFIDKQLPKCPMRSTLDAIRKNWIYK